MIISFRSSAGKRQFSAPSVQLSVIIDSFSPRRWRKLQSSNLPPTPFQTELIKIQIWIQILFQEIDLRVSVNKSQATRLSHNPDLSTHLLSIVSAGKEMLSILTQLHIFIYPQKPSVQVSVIASVVLSLRKDQGNSKERGRRSDSTLLILLNPRWRLRRAPHQLQIKDLSLWLKTSRCKPSSTTS